MKKTRGRFGPIVSYCDRLRLSPFVLSICMLVGVITCFAPYAHGQQESSLVKGIVTSLDDDEPIVGATILVKNTSIGVVTDLNGHFSVKVPKQKNAILVVSFIGMKTQEVPVDWSNEMKVTLETDSKEISEVVITGYQKIDRRLFTGSATLLKTKEITLDAMPDVTGMLQGQVAGVSVDNVSGTFGAAPVVRIRGNASINGNNKPLWVVDGMVLEDLIEVTAEDLTSGNISTVLSSGVAGLNPDDIEDIQILKDASATALYGARAMNGVIVISTRSGKKGKVNINYSGSVAIKERPSYSQFDIASSSAEMSIYKELYRKSWIDLPGALRARNQGVLGKMFTKIADGSINWGPNGSLNEEFLTPYANANTDWFDILFKNSVTNQHTISVSGGNEKMSNYLSLGYYNDNGLTVADEVERYTAIMKSDYTFSDRFRAGLKLSLNHRDQSLPGSKDREFNPIDGVFKRDFDINPFNYAMNTSRSMRAYDEKGDLEFFRRDYSDFNILYELEHNHIDLKATDVIGQVNLELDLNDYLTLTSISQLRRNVAHREHIIHENSNQANAYRAASTEFIRDDNQLLFHDPDFSDQEPYSILPTGGFYNTTENTLEFFSTRNSLAYNRTFHDTHVISVLLGQELKSTNRTEVWNNGWGIQYDRGNLYSEHPMLSKYLSLNNQVRAGRSSYTDRSIGLFANGAYSYAGKYTVNGTFRRDGSNQLGKTNTARYMNSWNISGKWNLNEEEWLKNSKNINALGLKATYGLSGTMGPSASAIQKLVAYQTWRSEGKETGIEIEDLANEDLTWEKMYEFSAGLEGAFFDNRIITDFAYYSRNSYDLIGQVRTSGIGGEHIKYGNFADMETEGFEFMLSTVNVKAGSFKWTTSINLDYSTNTITKLFSYDRISDYISANGGNFLGKSRKGLYSFRFDGISSVGLPNFVNSEGERINEYVDFQSQEDILELLKYEGVLEAPMSGGVQNTFVFKNFSMGANVVFRAGNKLRLDDVFPTSKTGLKAMGTESISKELMNRWSAPGDEEFTNVPAIVNSRFYKDLDSQSLNLYEIYNKSDQRVADGSFVKLRSVSLGYNIPKSIVQRCGLSRASISLQGQNICTIYSDSKLNGLDPEFFRSGGVALPLPRTYTIGVKVNL